ncbi:hypothetical protein GOP47_0008832 [Adiantum capillus-veneris]|uniref:Uncharacterized protein n=1 Tax=Adiantum capillus-veneris TaxID=13818 RepID=A0A9D4V0K1_ADICA|nr:hypothetical protein GOP47_0008832 [Adiantum capillus-veneris]
MEVILFLLLAEIFGMASWAWWSTLAAGLRGGSQRRIIGDGDIGPHPVLDMLRGYYISLLAVVVCACSPSSYYANM